MTTPNLSMPGFSNTLPKKKSSNVKYAKKVAPSLDKLNLGSESPKSEWNESNHRRLETEEINEDSIYLIYLKKITYTFNNSLKHQTNNSKFVTKCDQIDYSLNKVEQKSNSKRNDDQQSLQWETRQCRTLKAATLEHMVRYILLLTPSQKMNNPKPDSNDIEDERSLENNSLLEERNNAAHAMHVLFATYRQYALPWQLFNTIIQNRSQSSAKQFNFVLFYWLNNFPEDFWTCYDSEGGTESPKKEELEDLDSQSYSNETVSSYNSASSSRSSVDQFSPLKLADQLISMRFIDEEVKKHCLHLLDMKKENIFSNGTLNTLTRTSNKKSSIIDLEPKFIAQQLTAIDLEIFLMLKPYSLLSNVRSKTKIEAMIRNFNLLSRHVILSVLQNQAPHSIVSHWIEVAHNLRTMRNFNSLKAIIAGLTNESIYRLKNIVWNKLPRATITTFENLSSIVDDVNNQVLLRHTQLFIEGTSKVSLEKSFGTIPYLGTFLTDITMINTRYPNYIKLGNDTKLINFEKCSKHYEILIQMQLLQKNAIAALQQHQQNYQIGTVYSLNHYLSLRSQSVPSIPRVARIFRNWFQVDVADLPNDRECYQMSQEIESTPSKSKK